MKKTIGFFAIAVMAAVGAYAVIGRLGDKVDEKASSSAVANDSAPIQAVIMAETNAPQTASDADPAPACMKSPYKVALIVQNHTSDAPTLPMAAFADTLTARLSGKMFRIVNPHNVIGTNQNRTARGEEMPEASALNLLAHDPDLAGVITASIQEFTGRDIRHESKVIGHTLRVRLSLNFMDSSGGTVCGIDGFEDSKNCRPEDVKSDTATLCEELMHQSASNAAAALLAKDELKDWTPIKTSLIEVFFDCNVLGADVQVDGMSYGTTPAQLALKPGAHNLLISYPPYYFEFKRLAVFNQKRQRYGVNLQITPKGEEFRDRDIEYLKKFHELNILKKKDAFEYEKKMKLFDAEIAERGQLFMKQLELADAMIDRYEESGRTDDIVRIKLADGMAQRHRQSFERINITEGEADIDLSGLKTDSADLTEPPDWTWLLDGVKKLLLKK